MTSEHATPRHDGWTAERRRTFLFAIAEHGSVRAAARSAGMSATAAYALRGRDRIFDGQWAAAQAMCGAAMRDLEFERAVNGYDVPVFHKGERVGTRHCHDHKLLSHLATHFNWGVSPDSHRRIAVAFGRMVEAVDAAVEAAAAPADVAAEATTSPSPELAEQRVSASRTEQKVPTSPAFARGHAATPRSPHGVHPPLDRRTCLSEADRTGANTPAPPA